MAERRPGRSSDGPGRLIAFVYALFALAATGRSAYQLATKASEAPVAYTLSALAALVYLVGASLVVAVEARGRALRAAQALCVVELVGVLAVGTLSVVDESAFADASVWSQYGSGYGYVPAVLPVLALWWLRKHGVSAAGQSVRGPA